MFNYSPTLQIKFMTMNNENSILHTLDKLIWWSGLYLRSQKISYENYKTGYGAGYSAFNNITHLDISLDLEYVYDDDYFIGIPNALIVLKDLLFWNDIRPRNITLNNSMVYLKLSCVWPLPLKEYYQLDSTVINTHKFVATDCKDVFYPISIPEYSNDYHCNICSMPVFINKINSNIIHSKYNLNCDEYTMKEILM